MSECEPAKLQCVEKLCAAHRIGEGVVRAMATVI